MLYRCMPGTQIDPMKNRKNFVNQRSALPSPIQLLQLPTTWHIHALGRGQFLLIRPKPTIRLIHQLLPPNLLILTHCVQVPDIAMLSNFV